MYWFKTDIKNYPSLVEAPTNLRNQMAFFFYCNCLYPFDYASNIPIPSNSIVETRAAISIVLSSRSRVISVVGVRPK